MADCNFIIDCLDGFQLQILTQTDKTLISLFDNGLIDL